MMGKLLKYEFKATWKYICVMLLCVCITTAFVYSMVEMNQTALEPMTDDFGNVVTYVYQSWVTGLVAQTVMLITVVVSVICFGIKRFKRALTAPDGYLLNTLPVKASDIILSKGIVFILYSVLLVSLAFVGFWGLLFKSGSDMLTGTMVGMAAIATNAFNPTMTNILELSGSIFSIAVSAVSGILQIYAAMAIGHSFNKSKVGLSFAMYFIFAYAMNFLDFIEELLEYVVGNATAVTTISSAIFSVVFYLVTYYFMKNRLNIE